MTAHILLELLNKSSKKIKCEALLSMHKIPFLQ